MCRDLNDLVCVLAIGIGQLEVPDTTKQSPLVTCSYAQSARCAQLWHRAPRRQNFFQGEGAHIEMYKSLSGRPKIQI